MRIFWFSLIIIFIFIIFSIYFTYILEKVSGNIVASIEDIENKIDKDDWKEVQKDIDTLKEKWEGLSNSWSIFVEHSELDSIQVSLLKADEYMSMNNEVLTRAELSVLKYLVRHIYLKQKLELGNIF